MTKLEKIQYWVKIVDYDFKSANVMMKNNRYLYVGFMCHQSIEKILKALFTKIRNDTPPFTHNLLLLALECGITDKMDEETISFLKEILPLNIQTRYPTYKDNIYKKLNKNKASEILTKTKEFIDWIKSML